MLENFIPVLQSDARRYVSAALSRLQGQTTMVALDTIYNALRTGLAKCRDGAESKALIDAITPVVNEWVDRAMAELVVGEDNPVRRDLSGKRLSLLAELLANTAYVEAMRVCAEIQRGSSKTAALCDWATCYFQWVGLSYTAKALLDSHALMPWDGTCELFLTLVSAGVLPATPSPATEEPARSLAYLLLASDAFPAVGESGVAIAARACQQCAPVVMLATDFYRVTPLTMARHTGQVHRLVGWGGPSANDPALCFGFDYAAAQLLRYAEDAQTGHPPTWVRQAVGVELVLRRTMASWVDAPGRARNPALVKRPETKVAFDFLRIRSLYGQKARRLLSNDPLIWSVMLEDADEQGVSFLLPITAATLLRGGLLAIVISRQSWWLAQPRRVEKVGEHFLVAARWLGHDAEAVRFVGPGGDAWRVLYVLPGVSNEYQASILVDSPKLEIGKVYRAEMGDSNVMLKLTQMTMLGPATWRYLCQQV